MTTSCIAIAVLSHSATMIVAFTLRCIMFFSEICIVNKWSEMRKLKLQVQITVDGYVGGPDGDHDWSIWNWDNKLKAFAYPLRDNCDTILLGRKLADGFIPHFEDTVKNLQPNNADKALDEKFVYAHKMV